jgi:predicted DNA-binding transcriptional regulator YafY
MPSTLLTSRIRRKPVIVSSAHAQLVRQWQLLEWLSSEPDGVTVKDAADATGVNEKTIRRDLIMLRQIGFHLEEKVEERGRKRWRVQRPFERLRSKRRQYEVIRDGLDVLLEQAARVGDEHLADDLRTIRRRVVRKAK